MNARVSPRPPAKATVQRSCEDSHSRIDMARQPRLDVPGVAQHVIQRGNDRQACFASTADHARYRQELLEASLRFGCSVHSYVLMTNHVHILVTPAERGAVSRMMQAIGRRYVAGFNARYRRTGTLWEGRFKAGLVAGEWYVLTCYRYIELNPVRAGMVVTPEDHAWSSFGANRWAGMTRWSRRIPCT